jgi:hypothetical protein
MKKLLSAALPLGVLLLCALLLSAPRALAQPALSFSVQDGKTKQTLLSISGAPGDSGTGGLRVQQQLSTPRKGAPGVWKTTITNTAPEQKWLFLNWSAGWSRAHDLQKLHYWRGTGEPVAGESLKNVAPADANGATMMLQAIYDDTTGLALALEPTEIVSQLQQSLVVENGAPRLRLQIPLVLDAGQSDSFAVEVYDFRPRYGFLDALQSYYNAHPAAFSARAEIAPDAAGVGAAYTAWGLQSFERTRRFGGDWDWCYSPFRRTGDIYGRPQFWDYQPARPITDPLRKLPIEEFHAARREKFKKGRAAGAAMMFYVPAFIYCEENLAKEQYPGAIVYNPGGKYAVYFDRPWVTGHDNEVLMYPWANNFSKQSQEDARAVTEENDISGFAYDVLNAGYAFRGEGMQQSPRRAFDDKGEYVDLSIGVAKMMDFTRSLEKGGRKMALVGNPTGNTRAFLVARCDSAMYERPPYKALKELVPLRYAMGHKPLTWWDDWGISGMVNWREMSPAEIRAAYLGAADYVRLISYRWGGYPSPRLVEGVPSIARELPLLKEVILKGWQAVPAVRAASGVLPSTLWPARYGTGVGSFITLSNAGREAWSGRIAVDSDYLGARNYLFADVQGRALSQTLQGRTTIIEARIPSHQTLVLRAVAAPPANAKGAANVQWTNDGAKGQLKIDAKFPLGEIRAPRDGWQKTKGDEFTSRYFSSPAADILAFPFLGEDKTAAIVLPPNASPEEEWAAQRLQDYFAFWGKNGYGIAPPRAADLKIVRADNGSTPDAKTPAILISGDGKIQREGNVLRVRSDAKTTLREATLQLLALLDKKYWFAGTFPRGGEEAGEAEMIQKADLAGKLLGD